MLKRIITSVIIFVWLCEATQHYKLSRGFTHVVGVVVAKGTCFSNSLVIIISEHRLVDLILLILSCGVKVSSVRIL